jgi:hypothetical protein
MEDRKKFHMRDLPGDIVVDRIFMEQYKEFSHILDAASSMGKMPMDCVLNIGGWTRRMVIDPETLSRGFFDLAIGYPLHNPSLDDGDGISGKMVRVRLHRTGTNTFELLKTKTFTDDELQTFLLVSKILVGKSMEDNDKKGDDE